MYCLLTLTRQPHLVRPIQFFVHGRDLTELNFLAAVFNDRRSFHLGICNKNLHVKFVLSHMKITPKPKRGRAMSFAILPNFKGIRPN